MTQTTGAEFKKFYADDTVWYRDPLDSGNYFYLEDDLIIVNGVDQDMDTVYNLYGDDLQKIPDEATVSIESGDLVWAGDGMPPVQRGSFADEFDAWKAAQVSQTLVATFVVSRDMAPEDLALLRQTVQALGGTFADEALAEPAKRPKPR